MRRLVTVLGGSAFVGERVATRPELADLVLFEPAVPLPEDACRRDDGRPLAAPRAPASMTEAEPRVAAMRRAKVRVTVQVALADLAGQLDTRQATLVLSSLADAALEVATRTALGLSAREPVRGLAILAMGKLGGSEIGYGSDLDVIFLFDPGSDPDPVATYSRLAREVLRLLCTPHHDGPGYELDARLRPSGNQGLLVVSLDAFRRYHAGEMAEDDWRHPRLGPRRSCRDMGAAGAASCPLRCRRSRPRRRGYRDRWYARRTSAPARRRAWRLTCTTSGSACNVSSRARRRTGAT